MSDEKVIKLVVPDESTHDMIVSLLKEVADAMDQDGDAVGFALVVWDARGEPTTAFHTESGPISRALLPAYISTVLNQHVTVSIVEDEYTTEIGA